jgi:pimeloyl-ACP methyl ester carboxylesterase
MASEKTTALRLIALHAFPLDGRMWGLVKAAAATGQLGEGVAVTAPDFRGRGRSDLPAERVHAMSLLAKDVLALLRDDEPLVVMGLSMGGYVALELLARLGPQLRPRLRGVVLCDSRANADDDAGKKRRADSASAIEAGGMEPLLATMLPQFLTPGSRGGALEQLIRTMFLATPSATAAADQRGMAERPDRFDVLGTLTVPLLAAVGDEDALTPPSASEELLEAAVNAPYRELLTLAGAHLAPLEHPEEFLPKLRAFLDRCRG